MSYQVLARKWRPRSFDEVLGQAHVVRALSNGLELGRLHHAYLFTGTRGVGKTTLARILAKCLSCETGITAKPCGACSACEQIDAGHFVDFSEIDAASRTGVDDMRELLEGVNYAPSVGRFRIYLIDEVQMLSLNSFNALLKTLEEPPDHVKFFFATTHPKKLPVTILSRCLRFNLTRLLADEIEKHLASLLEAEAVQYEAAALKQIALAADGSVRDSLSLLDQAIAYGNGRLNTQEVKSMLGLADRDEVHALLRCVADHDAAGLFAHIENMHRRAVDFSSVLEDLIEWLHAIALRQSLPDSKPPPQFDAEAVAALALAMTPEDVQLFYQIALNGRRDLMLLPNVRSAFEMTLLRMLSFRPATETSSSADPNPAPAVQRSAAQSPPAPAQQPVSAHTPPPPLNASRQRTADQRTHDVPLTTPSKQSTPASATRTATDPHDRAPEKIKLTDFNSVDAWPKLIDRLGLKGAQRELCLSSVFSVQSENEVTLALDKDLDSIKTAHREEQIRAAFMQVAGHEVKVNFKIASPDEETPHQAHQRKHLQRQRDAEQSVDNHPVVQSLKSNFDANVVPGSTKPAE